LLRLEPDRDLRAELASDHFSRVAQDDRNAHAWRKRGNADGQIDAVYRPELGVFPFPRSIEAMRALAMMRGAASGFAAAEAFEMLRERQ
jgi:hypothetical protein